VRAYPDLRGQVDRVYASLQREPQVYTIHDPSDSTRSAVVLLDGDRVMQVLLRALDDPTALSLAPAAIADPASGQAAVDFAARSVLPPRDASWGALLSRACIDDAGSVGTAGLSVESEAAPEFAFVAEDPVLSACAVWGTPTARTRVAGPARAPTLILQGDLDPFTSREFAQEAARTFGDAVVVTLPRVGRVASISNPCVADLRSRFLAHPTTLVRGDCTRSIEPIPFAGM
jgi:pimeloyl-ACP methyl ester carboxylesterase